MNGKTKRELTWIGKDDPPRLEPRIFLADPEKSYHAAQRIGENDIFDNRLRGRWPRAQVGQLAQPGRL